MEDTLKQLQEYQLESLRRGISFDLSTYVLFERTELSVRLSYSDNSDIASDTRTFCTTFSNEVDDIADKMKMGRIKKFINDIDKQ